MSWIVTTGAAVALYFYIFTNANGGRADNPSNALDHPWETVKFFVYMLGELAVSSPRIVSPPTVG